MSYNFHIGQEIVALYNHEQGIFKKDDVFKVIGLRESTCKCSHSEVNIGLHSTTRFNTKFYDCDYCKTLDIPKKDSFWWFSSNRFAPLDELTNIDELNEVLEKPLFELL